MYEKKRVIRRTVRPVLRHPVWGLSDIQALPPRFWCVRCGAEVYRARRDLCARCSGEVC